MTEKTAQKEPGKKPAPSKKPKPQQEVVVQIPLSELHPFPDHPFQVRENASMGAFQQWTLKQADDPVFKVYRREYKRRFAWIKAGRISDSEFYAWSEQAREQKKKCDEGSITAEEFGRWLKES